MALELGRDFPHRWLATTPQFRQRVFDELEGICELLEPHTLFATWQQQQATRPAWPEARVTPTQSDHVAIDLKKRLLREADDVIEQALEPIRQHLREWLRHEMQVLLEQHQHPAATSETLSTPPASSETQ